MSELIRQKLLQRLGQALDDPTPDPVEERKMKLLQLQQQKEQSDAARRQGIMSALAKQAGRPIGAPTTIGQDIVQAERAASQISGQPLPERKPEKEKLGIKDAVSAYSALQKVQGTEKLERVDTGKEIKWLDKAGNVVRTMKKDVSPKQAKREASTQFVAANYGRRMEGAEQIFGDLSASRFDPTTLGAGFQRWLSDNSPLGNLGVSSEIQRQMQAERNFINANLRRESGAAISDKEFASAEKQYFPRMYDSPEVLEQKAENRQQAIAAMRAEAGTAWDKVGQVGLPKETVPNEEPLKKGGQYKGKTVTRLQTRGDKAKVTYEDGTSEVVDVVK